MQTLKAKRYFPGQDRVEDIIIPFKRTKDILTTVAKLLNLSDPDISINGNESGSHEVVVFSSKSPTEVLRGEELRRATVPYFYHQGILIYGDAISYRIATKRRCDYKPHDECMTEEAERAET